MNDDPTLDEIMESYYDADPQMGDVVFLKNNFEDSTIRGEVVGLWRREPQRGLDPSQQFEIVMYSALWVMIAGNNNWLDLEEWTITDTLRGMQYKKLPPEVVMDKVVDEMDDEDE